MWVEVVDLSEPQPEPAPQRVMEEEVPEKVEPEIVDDPIAEEIVEEIEKTDVIKPKPKSKPMPKPKPMPKSKPKPKPKPEPVKKDTVKTDSDWDMPDFEEIKSRQSLEIVQESYSGRVKASIDRFWRPPLGLDVKAGAKVVYKFIILKNGSLTQITKVKSSGSLQLDALGLKALEKSKLPPLPPQMGAQWSLEYGFVYKTR